MMMKFFLWEGSYTHGTHWSLQFSRWCIFFLICKILPVIYITQIILICLAHTNLSHNLGFIAEYELNKIVSFLSVVSVSSPTPKLHLYLCSAECSVGGEEEDETVTVGGNPFICHEGAVMNQKVLLPSDWSF
jgi:hypothetical protein